MPLLGEVVSFGEELLPLDEEPLFGVELPPLDEEPLFGVELLPLEPVEPLSLEPVVPVDPLEFEVPVEPSDELLEPLVPVAPVVPLLSGWDGRAVSAPFAPSVLPDDPVRDPSSLPLPRVPVEGCAVSLPCVLDPVVPVAPDDPLLVPLEPPELPLGLWA